MNDNPQFFKRKHEFTEWFLIGLLPIIVFGGIVDPTNLLIALSAFFVILFIQNVVISIIYTTISFGYWISSVFFGFGVSWFPFFNQALALTFMEQFSYTFIFSFIGIISGLVLVLIDEDAFKYTLFSIPIIQVIVDFALSPQQNLLLLFFLDFFSFWGMAIFTYAVMRGFLVSLPRIFYAEKFES